MPFTVKLFAENQDKSPWIPHILFVASLSLAAKMTDSNSSLLLADLEVSHNDDDIYISAFEF